MTGGRLGTRAVVALVATALLAIPALPAGGTPSSNLATARSRLEALKQRLSAVDEQYNLAVISLALTNDKLAKLRVSAGKTEGALSRATRAVSATSVDAFIRSGDQTLMIFTAQDLTELADRLEFVENLATRNADLLGQAKALRRRAASTQRALEAQRRSEQETVRKLAALRRELERGSAEAISLVRQLQAFATRSASVERASRSAVRPPPAPSPGAKKALEAAYSAIGTPYRYGGSSRRGFDCSGLTMWAWGHAGVSLPHSASAQYSAIRHISRSQLQPGDLVFFYSPISHVGMFVGNGKMIDASHPGETVDVRSIYWSQFSGAGRPGV